MKRESWTSSIGFILAATGSAIGLGNIWKFPYITGQNGGGTFVLIYIGCVLMLGIPVMAAEMLIGRHTRRNVINAMGKIERLGQAPSVRFVLSTLSGGLAVALALQSAWLLTGIAIFGIFAFAKKGFAGIGWLCIIVALTILSYYAVVGGWIVDYAGRALVGHLSFESPTAASAAFKTYISSPGRVAIGFGVFMILTGLVIVGGIRSGIERVSKFLMPALFFLLLAVIVRSITLPGASKGLVFFLKPTAAALSPKVFLVAMGQAFYSMSLGMAITVTYGSYLHKGQNILRATGWVCLLDTVAAMLGGLAIFPAVFAMGQNPADGPGLIFGTLPVTFAEMPFGSFWAALFFIMLLIAAVTSSASLLECGATVFIERIRHRTKHARCKREHAVAIGFVCCFIGGLIAVLSTADWSVLPWLERVLKVAVGGLLRGSWFDTIDNIASNWVLPFTALGIAILVGWCWGSKRAARELPAGNEPDFAPWLLWTWGFLIRWIVPVLIVLVFLAMTEIIKF